MAQSSMQVFSVERILLALLLLLLTTLIYYDHLQSPTHVENVGSHASTSAAKKSASKFAIITMTTRETSYDFMAFSSKDKYAAKHGYDMIWDFEEPNGYAKVWDKLNLTRDAVQSSLAGETGYEWIWMLDFDTLITNTTIRLEDVIEDSLAFAEAEGKNRDDIHLLLTRDCEPLNAGSMFFRAAPWILDFIEEWRAGEYVFDEEAGQLRNEQHALRDMLKENTFEVADKSIVVPQQMFDAYPEELPCRDPRDRTPWQPGMFLLHFAGANWWFREKEGDALGRLMKEYYKLLG